MPFIAWILVAYFALQGGMGMSAMIAKESEDAESTVAGLGISVLLLVAIYGWLVWAVVRLATT